MAALVIVLIIISCIILSFFVLVQNSKGGGLASNFAASNQIMGVRKTTETLEKGTWGVAAFVILLCLVFAFMTHSEFKQNSQSAETEQTMTE